MVQRSQEKESGVDYPSIVGVVAECFHQGQDRREILFCFCGLVCEGASKDATTLATTLVFMFFTCFGTSFMA